MSVTSRLMEFLHYVRIEDAVEKAAKAVPLSSFAYGEKQSVLTEQVDEQQNDESFCVRSESDDAVKSQNIIEEEEMSDSVSSEEVEEEDELAEDESDQEKENMSNTIVARSNRPHRAARTKVNYAIDDAPEDQDDDELMLMGQKDVKASAGGVQGSIDGEEERSIGSDTNINTSGDDLLEETLIDEAREGLNAVESILHHRRTESGTKQMRVKFLGTSYRRTKWVDREDLVAVGKQSLVRGYDKRLEQGRIDPYGDLEEGVHPEWCRVERILTSRETDDGTQYLVKWCGLNYSNCTWEFLEVLSSDDDKESLKKYDDRKSREQEKINKCKEEAETNPEISIVNVPKFCNGRTLRDYQLESLKWLVQNWYGGKNCILGDEMGLGKTAQSIACLEYQRQFGKVADPFLIIAPLTTLGHWKREIETWTDMDCILYCGNARDKRIIQTYEMWCDGVDKLVKPDVILSSYEHVMRDSAFFQSIEWETMVIDEAHRMKGTKGATRTCIAGIPCQWMLLLTGTPVQNNIKELFGLLNLLDPKQYSDEDDFLEKFGRSTDKMTPQQVLDLQRSLKPILLRRMKEDVETLPEKEECIIWVQLTREQRAYYKAIFENQISALLGGTSAKNVPALRNVAMELRKVCCHPFLCEGIEDDIIARNKKDEKILGELDLLVSSCGKMQLIHKLLPKLRAENRKVLIFSQFKIMLNVIEDYCNLMNYPVERIDGSTSSRDRQASIDRFSSTEKDGFIFLLSTKAGGQGITLTAADTCILYDSDWNPQNDLQAMARCHRIGQSKDVTIYRLVSKDTYEENLFRASSRKYGLDEAILGGIGVKSTGADNPEYDGKRISELLKHGAHCLTDSDAANQETDAFSSENIDEILTRRTEKRQIGGRAGNTFSVANFGEDTKVSKKEDQEFWKSVLPEACEKFEKKKNHFIPEVLPPRKKRSINYNEKLLKRRKIDEDFVFETADEDVFEKKPKKTKASMPKIKKWTSADLNRLFEHLLRYGMNLDRFKASEIELSYFTSRKYSEVNVMEVAVVLRECLMDIVEMVPRRERNAGYITSKDATPEQLEESDRLYLESLERYDRDIEEITDSFYLVHLPKKLVHHLRSSSKESVSNFDRKLIFRMASFAHSACDHISCIESLEKRLIQHQGKLPLPHVHVKDCPKFWEMRKENDSNLLKAIYHNGWDWTMRSSSKQLAEISKILREDDNFSEIRRVYIGSKSTPPETQQFIDEGAWTEDSESGYKKLAPILYNRIRKIFHALLEWQRLADASKRVLRVMENSPSAEEEERKTAKVSNQGLKTPGQEKAALNIFEENKGVFTGPTPADKSKTSASNSHLKTQNCRQKSIFEAFKIEPKKHIQQQQPPVDVDLTGE